MAFVIFDKGTFSNWGKPVKIASQSPKAGDPVKLIGYGFGWDDDIGYKIGIRRSGTNHITRILPNYAYAIGLQNSWNNKGASPNGGDSGSPLINDAEEILGVLSNEVKSTDLYVNLNDPAVKEFIDAVMKDPTPTGQSGQNLKSISFNNPQNIKNQVIKNNLPTTTDKDDL